MTSSNATANTVATGVIASALVNGSLTSLFFDVALGYPSDPTIFIRPASTTSTSGAAITNNSYFFMAITPSTGYTISLSSITFKGAKGGSSNSRGWEVRSSIDTYGATIQNGTFTAQRATFETVTITSLTATQYQNLSSGITFRIYLYSPNTGASIEMDDITVIGDTNLTTAILYTQLERFTNPRGVLRGVYNP